MTFPTQRVLETLLADPQGELYGRQIGEKAALARAYRPSTARPLRPQVGEA